MCQLSSNKEKKVFWEFQTERTWYEKLIAQVIGKLKDSIQGMARKSRSHCHCCAGRNHERRCCCENLKLSPSKENQSGGCNGRLGPWRKELSSESLSSSGNETANEGGKAQGRAEGWDSWFLLFSCSLVFLWCLPLAEPTQKSVCK